MSKRKTILIVAEGCPNCSKAKEDLTRRKVDLEILDVTKDLKAAAIVRDLGIVKVPAIVTVEKTEHGKEICTLIEETVKCVKASGNTSLPL